MTKKEGKFALPPGTRGKEPSSMINAMVLKSTVAI